MSNVILGISKTYSMLQVFYYIQRRIERKKKNKKKINDKERKKMKQNYTAIVYYMQDYL